MAIKAANEVTITDETDIDKLVTWYYLTTSAIAPSAPTTTETSSAPPSPWTANEPTFQAGTTTNYLYTCIQTQWKDGSCKWSTVQLSSSYEQAKQAWNKANAAQENANSANFREQRIYKSAASGTTSMSGTTTWITSVADTQNAWTARRPKFSSSYPVLFTATQRQTVQQQVAGQGECTCTTPYIDESAAVAGNYITKVSTGGDAWIHSEGHGPNSQGEATTSTYGWRIGSVFQLIRGGIDWFKLWLEESTNKIKMRLGREDSGHVVLDESGMEVFDYDSSANIAKSVALFGKNGARIGKAYDDQATDNESHMELDFNSMKLIDKEGTTYLHVSDLRTSDGSAHLISNFICDGVETYFWPYVSTMNSKPRIGKVLDSSGNDVTSEYQTYWDSGAGFNAHPAPPKGFTVTLDYYSDDDWCKAYTMGFRNPDAPIGPYSFAEGKDNESSSYCSHVEGRGSTASADSSHAEGFGNTASGQYSHSEGNQCTAEGWHCHAEGVFSRAHGDASHAEGDGTYAYGEASHAEGISTRAFGRSSHTHGLNTRAYSPQQTVIGRNNVLDMAEDTFTGDGNTKEFQLSHTDVTRLNVVSVTVSGRQFEWAEETSDKGYRVINNSTLRFYNYVPPSGSAISIMYGFGKLAFVIGNGNTYTARSNAFAVDWSGNTLMAGEIQDMSGNSKYTKTRVKGNAETTYRTGDVNLTPANIGAAPTSHSHDYLPLSGDTMTGRMKFKDGTAMPNASTSGDFFAVGFQAFSNGGGVWYKGAADMRTWLGLNDLVQVVSATSASVNIAANSNHTFAPELTIPNGYTLVGALGAKYTMNNANLSTGALYKYSANKIACNVVNHGSSARGVAVTTYGLCVKTAFL